MTEIDRTLLAAYMEVRLINLVVADYRPVCANTYMDISLLTAFLLYFFPLIFCFQEYILNIRLCKVINAKWFRMQSVLGFKIAVWAMSRFHRTSLHEWVTVSGSFFPENSLRLK